MPVGAYETLFSWVPILRRLPYRIDKARQEISGLRSDAAALRDALDAERAQHATARQALAKHESALGSGHLIELEYPYRPRDMTWDDLPKGNVFRHILSREEAHYRTTLQAIAGLSGISGIPASAPESGTEPFWNNAWFPVFDGIAVYGLLATRNPRVYFEVGSGNSTKFARRAIRDHNLRTKIVSVDPSPRAEIDGLCDEVIRCGLEDVDLARFADLGAQDILFVDNSHRSAQGSDVTVFFTRVLPSLGAGCVYGLHDILLPSDYGEGWFARYYNEQYLLMAYLLGGAGGDRVLLPMQYVWQQAELRALLSPVADGPIRAGGPNNGSSFWMLRA